MTSENTRLWDSVSSTDPKHTKKIVGKPYQGTSPKPYWIVRRLTETFGPCGDGWGITVSSERVERFPEDESVSIALVTLWYRPAGRPKELPPCMIQQVGQTRMSYKTQAGKLIVDEDAPKKSVTDAMVKCASYLGFAGDIFMGLWDDCKYQAENAAAWAAPAGPPPAPPPSANGKHTPAANPQQPQPPAGPSALCRAFLLYAGERIKADPEVFGWDGKPATIGDVVWRIVEPVCKKRNVTRDQLKTADDEELFEALSALFDLATTPAE